MEGYFDIHAHILPGVDDGAKDENQARKMLQTAHEEGICSIMATPHFYSGEKRYSLSYVKEVFEKTKDIAEELGIKLYLGNEICYAKGIIEALDKKEALTLADSAYVLIEFFPESAYREIYRGLRELTQNGYRPIVAHVERYISLMEKKEYFEELIELGCLMQMNTRSFLGGIMNTEARQYRKLIKKDYIHFFGSDCHNLSSRPPQMKTSLSYLKKKKISEDIIRELAWENAQKVIINEVIK